MLFGVKLCIAKIFFRVYCCGCTMAVADERAGELGSKVVRGRLPIGRKEGYIDKAQQQQNNKTEMVLHWGEPMATDDAHFNGLRFSTFSPIKLQGQSNGKTNKTKKTEVKQKAARWSKQLGVLVEDVCACGRNY